MENETINKTVQDQNVKTTNNKQNVSEVIPENAPHLYDEKSIIGFSILFSVIYAGIIFCINLKETNKKDGILPVLLFSTT